MKISNSYLIECPTCQDWVTVGNILDHHNDHVLLDEHTYSRYDDIQLLLTNYLILGHFKYVDKNV